MNLMRRRWVVMTLLALLAGALHAASFAPMYLPWLQVLALACLFALETRSTSAKASAVLGLAFGLGWFGVGISWVYVSMHVYGQMPAWLAGAATAAFCGYLAVYPALALAVARKLFPNASVRLALGLPALWMFSEWLRGTVFTGFPWLASGYAHTDGPLAGWAPTLGMYGVTLVAGLLAGGLALLAQPRQGRAQHRYAWAAGILVVTVGGGWLGRTQQWTQATGTPIKVRLVQANVPQELKFEVDGITRAFKSHWALMQGPAAQIDGSARDGSAGDRSVVDLIALPESVFPVPLQLVPVSYLEAFRELARRDQTAVIFGVFLEEPRAHYFNSAVAYSPTVPAEAGALRYSKRHLVPFGEFIPPGFRWFVNLMQMPIGDQQRGKSAAPIELAGQRIAVNICYEDLFGAEIIEAWHTSPPGTGAPTMMLNMSNLAWFNDSLALPQHLQISRMRVLETQHPMLRATNTGATAIIDARGEVVAQLPFLTAAALDGQVQGQQGTTPFIRYGNGPALLLGALGVALALIMRRR